MELRSPKMRQLTRSVSVAILCLGVPASLSAQESRSDLFQAMLAAPNDTVAMMAFAQAATAERDYEAVVSTLERLLDLEPANAAARFELGVAYYALGSYELAEFHLRLVKEQSTSGALSANADTYLERIGGRHSENGLSGEIAAGAAVTDDGTAAALRGKLRWNADLGGANDHTWQTDLRFTGYSGEDELTASQLSVKTGPLLSADGLAFGVRFRPYVEAQKITDSDGRDYATLSLGAQYLNAHTANWSSYADLKFGAVSGYDGSSDGSLTALVLGTSYTPSRATRLRFSLFFSEFDADTDAQSYTRKGVRAEWRQAFATTTGNDKRPSIATAYLQHSFVDYDTIDREDDVTSLGVSYRKFLRGDVFMEVGGRYVQRESSVNGLDKSTSVLSILIGREF